MDAESHINPKISQGSGGFKFYGGDAWGIRWDSLLASKLQQGFSLRHWGLMESKCNNISRNGLEAGNTKHSLYAQSQPCSVHQLYPLLP